MKRIIRFLLNSIIVIWIVLAFLISIPILVLASPIFIAGMFLDILIAGIIDWAYFDIPFKDSAKETYKRWTQ